MWLTTQLWASVNRSPDMKLQHSAMALVSPCKLLGIQNVQYVSSFPHVISMKVMLWNSCPTSSNSFLFAYPWHFYSFIYLNVESSASRTSNSHIRINRWYLCCRVKSLIRKLSHVVCIPELRTTSDSHIETVSDSRMGTSLRSITAELIPWSLNQLFLGVS